MRTFYLLIVIYTILHGCTPDTNPLAIERVFFGCYDADTFGPLRPEIFNGLPSTCESIIFKEPFDNNDRNWTNKVDSKYEFNLVSNYYRTLSKDNTPWYLYKYVGISSFPGNYQVEARIKMVAGQQSEFSSICWGGKDWKFFNFGISQDGKYVIRERTSQSAAWKILKTASPNSIISKNDWNFLAIRKFDKFYYFFINNQLVADLGWLPEHGSEIGFFIPGNSETWFDDLTIQTWRF